MASIHKTGPHTYTVQYSYKGKDGVRHRKTETFHSKRQAEERKKELEQQLRGNSFVEPNRVTVEAFLREWLPIQSGKHGWAPKTYESELSLVENLILPYIGKEKLCRLSTYAVEKFYEQLRSTPCGLYRNGVRQQLTPRQQQRTLSGTSINHVHRLLKTAFSYAVEWGLLAKNPVPKDGPKKSTVESAIWDRDTMVLALENMESEPMLHLAVHLSIVGAMRLGEVCGLRIPDIDFSAYDGKGAIYIRQSLQRIKRDTLTRIRSDTIIQVFESQQETSKSVIILKATKNESSKRFVYLTIPLKAELEQWLVLRRQHQQELGQKYHDHQMLLCWDNGNPVEPVAVRKMFDRWKAENPEFEKIKFHGLRHSSATYQLLLSNGDIKAVQGVTGHASADVLVNTYAHIQHENRKKLVRKLDEDFYTVDSRQRTATPDEAFTAEKLLAIIEQSPPEIREKIRKALLE